MPGHRPCCLLMRCKRKLRLRRRMMQMLVHVQICGAPADPSSAAPDADENESYACHRSFSLIHIPNIMIAIAFLWNL